MRTSEVGGLRGRERGGEGTGRRGGEEVVLLARSDNGERNRGQVSDEKARWKRRVQ